MATGADVLKMLCPDQEWTIYGDDFESIIWHNGDQSITKEQFDNGFDQYDAWEVKQQAEKAKAKEELLNRLGITSDEAALLLG